MKEDYLYYLQHKDRAVYFFLKKIKYHNYMISNKKLKKALRITSPQMIYHTNIIMFYAEALLFEVSSYLDILIKFLTDSEEEARLNFIEKKLKHIKPQDEYIISLMEFYKKGLGNPDFSIEQLKSYRHVISHSGYIKKFVKNNYNVSFEKKEKVWAWKEKICPLPDNPEEKDPKKWTFNKDIDLVDFCKEIDKLLQKIIKETNKKIGEGIYYRLE